MQKNKIILSHCPNFYKINDFSFYEDDYISAKLIEIYREFIFSVDIDNSDEINKLEQPFKARLFITCGPVIQGMQVQSTLPSPRHTSDIFQKARFFINIPD